MEVALELAEIIKLIASAGIGAVVREVFRVRAKLRLVVRPAKLPVFVLSTKRADSPNVTMRGEYGILNLSDVPISLMRPRLLGYNLSSRAFQFSVRRQYPFSLNAGAENGPFEELTVKALAQETLLSGSNSVMDVERFGVRSVPAYLWLETLEMISIAARSRFRSRAFLYKRGHHDSAKSEFWYHPVQGVDVASIVARLIALPGKQVYRWRCR